MKAKLVSKGCLSFWVVRIIERMDSRTVIKETVLRGISIDGELVVRGARWKVGDKVDFREI